MCHGTFDIVHPGHIRHLLYAKSKGDILVASLTADAHIMKANFRPFVPQDLRALNLAALEMVDYVVIDQTPRPSRTWRIIAARLFRQRLRIHSNGLPREDREEMEVLEGYGGEIIFTPGDIVYSSSNLIETEPPKLRTRS